MGLTSLQVCMDSSDNWLQGSFHEESSLDSSSSPSGDYMLTCSRPLIERRLRTQQDQALNCPRCDSTHTKFCYYNNYSLTQPRYFCKTCRRYWTKGGTLRNIPVGGGCRKNKKVSSKKSNNDHQPINQNHHQGVLSSSSHNSTHLQLSFPHDVQYSHFNNLLGNIPHGSLENPLRPIDFMDGKLEAMVGNPRNYEFIGSNGELGTVDGLSNIGSVHGLDLDPSYHHGLCSTYNGMSLEGNSTGTVMNNTCQRLMLPYEANMDQNAIDVKPNPKILSLEWQNQDSSGSGKDSFGYHNGLGSWINTSMMNNYGPSTANPLL